MNRRRLAAALGALGALVLVGAACTKEEHVYLPAVQGRPVAEAGPPEPIAPEDAGADEADKRDANGPAAEGETCSFNHDCQLKLRCECDGECACAKGARGTKKAGEPCDAAGDCESSVCLEGAAEKVCSDECAKNEECPRNLPICAKVSLVGKICIREQP